MDSRIVAREIKNEIWPLLRREGFTEFSAKTAWRPTPEQIHVVNYQSFNSYLAERVGCTTFSFALNLGIFFRAVPLEHPVKKGHDPSFKPQDYHCHFRHRLPKNVEQPVLPRSDIWYVERDGSNLLQCLDDSRTSITREGLPWFARFESLESVLKLLMEQDQLLDVSGVGTRTSPARKRTAGYIANAIGRSDIGERLVEEAETEMRAFGEQLRSRREPQKGK
jgi:hypothetical protein